MKRTLHATVAVSLLLVAAPPVVALQAGASSGARISGSTHVDRAIGKCVAALVVGGGLGAILGKKKGAVIGLGVAAGVCALIIRAASKKDKALIREAQLVALNNASIQRANWVTEDGAAASLTVMPTGQGSVVTTDSGSIKCRADNYCNIGDTWYPKDQILAKQVDPNAPKLIRASFQSAQEVLCRRNRTVMSVNNQPATDGSDLSCLVGDTWVTGDSMKQRKIKESDVVI